MKISLEKFYKDKKVLVTGHTGFKGGWLTQILLSWGAEVTGVSLYAPSNPHLYGILGLEKNIKSHTQDIRDYAKLKKIIGESKADIIFHMAAQPIVRDSYDNPLDTVSTNTMGTTNVLEAIRTVSGIKAAVMITTDKVYQNREWVYPYRETDSLGGTDPYSGSKSAADIIINTYIQSFFNIDNYKDTHNTLIAIARAGNVIGGGDWANHRLIPDIIRSIYKEKKPVIIRNPTAIRPWQHALEPLYGYLLLASMLYGGNKKAAEAWNFGPNHQNEITVSDLVKRAIKILEKGEMLTDTGTNIKHESNLLKLDINKTMNFLGWKPLLDLDTTLNLTFDWYKTYYTDPKSIIALTNQQINYFVNKI